MTLLARADAVTPVEARLFAKKNGVALTSVQLEALSGLTRKTINRLSRKTTWARVQIQEYDRFMKACGVTEANRWRVRPWLLRSAKAGKGFRHIRRLISKNTGTQNGPTARFYAGLVSTYFGGGIKR